jgi:phosphate transport system substrate-binding protein
MARAIGIIFSLAITLLLSGCYGPFKDGQGEKKQTITIAGSTSVMPFTEKLAEHFMVDHPRFVVDVQGGGSTAGVQACMNKTVNIGMSSRQLKEEEMTLKEIVICYDGISVVVHPSNPIAGLTLKQVAEIYAGKITKWSELGWVDRKIDIITREEGSGTRGSFEDLVMKDLSIDDGIMVQDSNGSVKEIVATDPYALGYISLGLVDKRVKALSIDGIIPTVGNIKAKKYMIVRPFLYLTNGEPGPNVKPFIDYVLKDGQRVLVKEGLISVND